ncbi:MAG: hypothetical protein ACOY82_14435 [Pseudomonadota bacterium]
MANADLDFDDWVDLLGLRDDLDALAEGRASPMQTRVALAAARLVYPGVMGDYVRAIEGMDTYVDAVDRAIVEQNAMLEEFDRSIGEAGLSFSWDRTRLLSEEKRDEIDRIQAYLEEEAAKAEEAAAEADDGIAELQDQIDALEEQLAELGDEAVELSEQIAELEEQLAAAEEGGDE